MYYAELAQIPEVAATLDRHDFALIPGIKFEWITARDESILRPYIETTSKAPNLIGYYTFDEPENHYWASHKDKYADMSAGSKFVAAEVQWIYDLIHKYDTNPDHYVMPCIASWDHYGVLSGGYDVNMPNQYCLGPDTPDFQGDMYTVLHDARLAAKAVREYGRHSFVYTPQACDKLAGSRRPTVAEHRYMTYAPLTAGAMGIVYWTQWRSHDETMEELILPEMKLLSGLSQYFLGEWQDSSVTSTGDVTSCEYLTKYNLPDCAYCVRKAPDGSVLLLVVNNTKSDRRYAFNLPQELRGRTITEYFSGTEFSPRQQRFATQFGPFDTKAFIFR